MEVFKDGVGGGKQTLGWRAASTLCGPTVCGPSPGTALGHDDTSPAGGAGPPRPAKWLYSRPLHLRVVAWPGQNAIALGSL